MFCCFSGRILGGTVSTDIGVTHLLISLRILLFFWRHIYWLGSPFGHVLSLSPCSLLVSYLKTQKFTASSRRLSSALLTVVTWRWNRPPHSFCSAMKFGLFSVNMCTQRITGTPWKMARKCTTRHYMMPKFVCGVLWVQLEILVSFSFLDNKFTTMLPTIWHFFSIANHSMRCFSERIIHRGTWPPRLQDLISWRRWFKKRSFRM